MRRIKFNPITRLFSTITDDQVTGIVDDGTSEPIDYLDGTPATVLDLKEPLTKYDEDVLNKLIKDDVDVDDDRYQTDSRYRDTVNDQMSRMEDNYLDAISNFNKESAINHRLNELGSTDYDFAGEKYRVFNPTAEHINSSSAMSFEAPGIVHYFAPESLDIGIKDYFGNAPEIISHELGHVNDPHNNNLLGIAFGGDELDTYDTKYTADKVSDKYGNDLAKIWDGMEPNETRESTFRHDHAPFELYADAAALRSNLFKSGAWNGSDQITEDMVNKYLESENAYRDAMFKEHGLNNVGGYATPGGDFTIGKRLKHYLDIDKIADLLNSSRKFSNTENDEMDEYINKLAEGDLSTVDTKEFIGVKEPNRPFHRTSFKYGK